MIKLKKSEYVQNEMKSRDEKSVELRIKMTNIISILLLFIFSLNTVLFFREEARELAYISFTMAVVSIIILSLNRYKKYDLSRYLLIVSGCIFAFVLIAITGVKRLYFIYFLILLYPIVVFDYKEKNKIKTSTILLFVIFSISLIYTFIFNDIAEERSLKYFQLIDKKLILGIFIVVDAIIFIFYKIGTGYLLELDRLRENLEEEVKIKSAELLEKTRRYQR